MAKKSYKDLKAAVDKLAAEAEAVRLEEVQEVALRCVAEMNEYGITLADLKRAGFKSESEYQPTKTARKVKVAPVASDFKYKDLTTGNTWIGRGRQPAWLKEKLAQGMSLEHFKV